MDLSLKSRKKSGFFYVKELFTAHVLKKFFANFHSFFIY